MSWKTSCTCCTQNSTVFTKIRLTMSNQGTQIYKLELIKCFNLAFGTNHDASYNFSDGELFEFTPAHIYSCLALKVFGTTSPLATDKPTQGRSSTIEYSKKAISYFMLNKLSLMGLAK